MTYSLKEVQALKDKIQDFFSVSLVPWEKQICIRNLQAEDIYAYLLYPFRAKNSFYDFKGSVCSKAIEEAPLFVNDPDPIVRIVALWRLKLGK